MDTREIRSRFLDECVADGLSDNTVASYDWATKKVESSFPDELPTDSSEIVDLFLAHEDQLASASLEGLHRKLATFFRWVEEKGYGVNVMSGKRRRKARMHFPRTLTRDEIRALLAAARNERDQIVIECLLDTGIRISELASMGKSDIKDHCIYVYGKSGARAVPVSPHIREKLLSLGDETHIWLGRRGPLTSAGLQQIVKRTMRHAGLKPPRLGPHVLRHTFATMYIIGGGDVYSLQQILGHSKVETTMLYVSMSADVAYYQHQRFSPMADEASDISADKDDAKRNAAEDAAKRCESMRQKGLASGKRRRAKCEELRKKIIELDAEGLSKTDIMQRLGCSIWTVRRALRPKREED